MNTRQLVKVKKKPSLKKIRKRLEETKGNERKLERRISSPSQPVCKNETASQIIEIPTSATQQQLLLVFKNNLKNVINKKRINKTSQTKYRMRNILHSVVLIDSINRSCQTNLTRRKIETTNRAVSAIQISEASTNLKSDASCNIYDKNSDIKIKSVESPDIVIIKEAMTNFNFSNNSSIEENLMKKENLSSSFAKLICWHQPRKLVEKSTKILNMQSNSSKDEYYIVLALADPRPSSYSKKEESLSQYLHYVTSILDPQPSDLANIFTFYPSVVPGEEDIDKRMPRIYKITKANINSIQQCNNLYYIIPQMISPIQDQHDLYRIEPIKRTVMRIS